MPQSMRFQPVDLDDRITLNERQEACLLKISDAQGNIVELAMSVEFGAKLVERTRAAFRALKDRKLKEEGTTAEQRQSFAAKSALIGMPITAAPNPHGTPLAPVLVTVAPASTYEQSFGLSVEWAERLAEELRAAASQVSQRRS
ncbi:hypothetical protein [Chelativorans sp.]|uniref:hypothetical protein n=1 Tax=Chelativorans sp. TaxID=2203393 RepID=UPI00281261B0|nr:hypothetical protein [Chelativorans sp.]